MALFLFAKGKGRNGGASILLIGEIRSRRGREPAVSLTEGSNSRITFDHLVNRPAGGERSGRFSRNVFRFFLEIAKIMGIRQIAGKLGCTFF